MRSKVCSFCGLEYEPGTGIEYVKADGSVLRFCSSKCRKNQALGRIPIRIRWTQKFRDFREESGASGAKKPKKETLVEKIIKPRQKKEKKVSKRKQRKKESRGKK